MVDPGADKEADGSWWSFPTRPPPGPSSPPAVFPLCGMLTLLLLLLSLSLLLVLPLLLLLLL